MATSGHEAAAPTSTYKNNKNRRRRSFLLLLVIADHSAASMRTLSASLSTHGMGLLLDLLSTTMPTGDSSLMMWFKER